VIEVEDRGVGFDHRPATARQTKGGFGMLSIRERLAHFGGEVVVVSKPGHGTRTTLRVPVNS
jgi:signal transduction histidine kinase